MARFCRTEPQALQTAASTEPGSDSDRAQYLTFMPGGEVYAMEILVVREIIGYGGLTEVPMMPSSIRGVINLRGGFGVIFRDGVVGSKYGVLL